jgi:hypothetical protein
VGKTSTSEGNTLPMNDERLKEIRERNDKRRSIDLGQLYSDINYLLSLLPPSSSERRCGECRHSGFVNAEGFCLKPVWVWDDPEGGVCGCKCVFPATGAAGSSFKEFLAEQMRDPEFRAAYEQISAEEDAKLATTGAGEGEQRPSIICLCGSTRFVQTWIDEYQRLSDEGNIVLTVARMPPRPNLQHDEPELKARLDNLHLRKIDLADEVFVLDVDGYVGSSTKREIEYATAKGKPIRYLSQESAASPVPVAEGEPMPRLPFICGRCKVQQHANGICANCGSPAISAQPAPAAAPVVETARDDDSEGLTSCLDDDGALSRALRQITPERLDEILREQLPNRSTVTPSEGAIDDYVAWCRYVDNGNRVVLCDSDADGAFKVYRSAPADDGEVERLKFQLFAAQEANRLGDKMIAEARANAIRECVDLAKKLAAKWASPLDDDFGMGQASGASDVAAALESLTQKEHDPPS